MPTLPCLDINLMTPACVLWDSDSTTQSLVEPDPPSRHLSLEIRFDSETSLASFTIHCPIRLKGIESHSFILGSIPPDAITSFTFKPYPNPPEAIRKRLNCTTIRLRFSLNQPLHLIVPVEATEPVLPRKRLSGEVCDTLCSLASVTIIDIYVSDRDLPHIKLNAIRDAVAQARLKPFDADFPKTLASLFNGRGGKLIDPSILRNNLSILPSNEPPAYDELEPPPPSVIEPTSPDKSEYPPPAAQSTVRNDKKRRRLGDSSSLDENNRLDLALAMLLARREEMDKLAKRVEQLEKKNKELSEELDALRASCDRAADGVNTNEVELLEMEDHLNELSGQVDFIMKNGLDSDVEQSIVQRVTNRAVTNIVEKNYKLSVEES
ncbi:hypothetical protein B0T10DRAFT_522965 [Thelonectria olida]|uniref:Uncharacterized protein n=1 Tax=Thelonectria olida TaxID=1576542 RepID=A0A9P8VPJ8_9HYPO|nr:hypothetical protein B0T10DRAFT_522965 [Thelonectria olida]